MTFVQNTVTRKKAKRPKEHSRTQQAVRSKCAPTVGRIWLEGRPSTVESSDFIFSNKVVLPALSTPKIRMRYSACRAPRGSAGTVIVRAQDNSFAVGAGLSEQVLVKAVEKAVHRLV